LSARLARRRGGPATARKDGSEFIGMTDSGEIRSGACFYLLTGN